MGGRGEIYWRETVCYDMIYHILSFFGKRSETLTYFLFAVL